jgi:hypothetical protein
MASKEQSMRKWIYEMEMLELVHLERMIEAAKEKLKRQKLIEIQLRAWRRGELD